MTGRSAWAPLAGAVLGDMVRYLISVAFASRHDTPGVQGKQRKQNPQLAATDVDRTARLIPHLKRA